MESKHLSDFMSYSKNVLSARVERDSPPPTSSTAADTGDSGDDKPAPLPTHVSHLSDSTFLCMGVLSTLSHLFKYGNRLTFLKYVDAFLSQCILLNESGRSQTGMRKLLVKLFQRVGTTFMPVRVVPWRYKRGRRSLVRNMEAGAKAPEVPKEEEATADVVKREPTIHVP